MVFSSVTFLFVFLPVTLLLYYIVPKRCRNLVLLLMSLVFYAWGEPVYVILMLYSILLNYGMGRLMDSLRHRKKAVLVFTVILNLFILGFFKYYGFVLENINALTGLQLPVRKISLPIGISFYTFQALSYIIDLYRGKFRAQKNLISFACYITMFPQLIAGPIVRYEDIERQLSVRSFSMERFGFGAMRFIFGLAKKVLLANLIGALFDTVHAAGADVSVLTAWLGALAYTFQIYFDFSGYSDMAIGLGQMLGFSFMANFRDPYAAKSVTDFWRRWHISLGTWFREYVYIPLGGNRVSAAKHVRNILVVWALTGLWHGASWNFVIWGLYYGLLLLFDKYVWQKLRVPGFITRVLTLLMLVIGWVIFSADSLTGVVTSLTSMFGFAARGLYDGDGLYYLRTYLPLLVLEVIFCLPFVRRVRMFFMKNGYLQAFLYLFTLALLFISVSFLVTQNYNPFLYFRF